MAPHKASGQSEAWVLTQLLAHADGFSVDVRGLAAVYGVHPGSVGRRIGRIVEPHGAEWKNGRVTRKSGADNSTQSTPTPRKQSRAAALATEGSGRKKRKISSARGKDAIVINLEDDNDVDEDVPDEKVKGEEGVELDDWAAGSTTTHGTHDEDWAAGGEV